MIPSFDVNIEKCKTCMLTKITIQTFPNVKRNFVILELIHSDLCDGFWALQHCCVAHATLIAFDLGFSQVIHA